MVLYLLIFNWRRFNGSDPKLMIQSNFKNLHILHDNSSTTVYRATRISDGSSVILKELKQSARTAYKMSQFVNEEKTLKNLNHMSVPKLLQTIRTPAHYFNIFEDIGGTSLYDVILEQQLSLSRVLHIALTIATTLRYLHQESIIHADINPKNIIYNHKTNYLQIIDFGISLSNDSSTLHVNSLVNGSGNFFYMAPEQTGLTEYITDARSDFYSFGMTLYHLFLGKIPLKAKDQYELIHKQIAVKPKALCKVNNEIPAVISDIVDKLINKQPYKRYQTDDAIIYDISQCLKLLDNSQKIQYFELATMDKPEIEIGDTLFGRDKEVETISKTIKNLNSQPLSTIISGATGVGKTRLAQELFTYFDTTVTSITTLKFEKNKEIITSLGYRELFAQLASNFESKDIGKLLDGIHPSTPAILINAFPELKPFFSLKLATSQPKENFENLHFAIKDFFINIASKSKPLILFLDDAQWITQADSQLICKIILESKNKHLHFVVTYRTTQDYNPDLEQLLKTLRHTKQRTMLELELTNLDVISIDKLLAHIFHQDSKNTAKLASIVHNKTGGNPFYIKSFIKSLIDSNTISFNKGEWEYSLEKVNSYSKTNNMAEILKSKFNDLSSKEISCLECLSILGSRFNLSLTLNMMQYYGFENALLKSLVKHGFIELLPGQYQFAHDTIQEYIIESIDPMEKQKIHLNVGLYLEKHNEENSHYNMRTITTHLNRAYRPSNYPKRMFALNINALEEMLLNNSTLSALGRVQWIDENLIGEDFQEKSAKDLFSYSLLKAKVLYLNSKFEESNHLILKLLKESQTISQKLVCFSHLKDTSVTQGKNFQELAQFGDLLLSELDLCVPQTKDELIQSVLDLELKITNHKLSKETKNILTLKNLRNAKVQQTLSLLVEYWEAQYYLHNLDVMKWCYLNIVDLSFRYGNSSESSFGYVLYGADLTSKNEFKKAQKFGEIALKLNEKFQDKNMLPKIYNFVANFISPYTKNVSKNIPLYKKSLSQSKINGDIVFGTWANFLMHFSEYLSGSSLDSLSNNISNKSDFLLMSGDAKIIGIFNILKSSIEELQDNKIHDDDSALLKEWETEKFYPALAWYAIIKAQQCFLNNEMQKGLEVLDKRIHSSDNAVIMFPKINLHFIRALLLLHLKVELNSSQQKCLREDIDELELYYQSSKTAYKFHHTLISIYKAREEKSTWDIAKIYDKAIAMANKENNQYHLSLANICAAHFWEESEYASMKNLYVNQAITALNQWGAYGVADRLKIQTDKIENSTLYVNSSSTSQMKNINYQSLMKSYSAISSPKDNTELIKKLMNIILQNATASKGVFILKEKGHFFVKAVADYTEDNIEIVHEEISNHHVPSDVVKHVIESTEHILLQHPSQSGMFQLDPYIKEHKPASISVIPMMMEGFVQGILYLENSEISTKLGDENIKILKLLLTQSSTVFSNTLLIDELKENDQKLNKAQEISNVGSWEYNVLTGKITWSAQTYRIFGLEPFSEEIDYDKFSSFIHPDDVNYIEKSLDEALSTNAPSDVQHRIIVANGEIKVVHQRAEVFTKNYNQYMSGTIQDITQQQKDKEQISSLSQVVEQSPLSVAITDTNGYITYVNKEFIKISGYARKELVGFNMNILSSGKQSLKFYKEMWQSLLTKKKSWRGTLIDKVKNGTLVDMDSTIFPIYDDKKQVTNFVAVQMDITEQNIQDRLFLMQTRQAQMGEMISMIAHQWRQPLAAISATAATLELKFALQSFDLNTKEGQEAQAEYCNKYLGKIGDYTSALSTTIDDFRNFYKPDKKANFIKFSDVAQKSMNLIRASLLTDDIEIIERYDSTEPIELYDSEMLQVILNILKNAHDNFLETKVKEPKITITTTNNTLTICDNGGGIDDDALLHIFEAYFSTKDEKNGTGLGLHMSKTIVETHHHGSLRAINTEDGVCFKIEINGIKEVL